MNYSLALLLLNLVCLSISINPSPTELYPNQLNQVDTSFLYWRHNNTDIIFEIHYKNTNSWLLFGVGSEEYSDVIVGWVNENGIGHFSDRKLNNKQNILTIDEEQNWFLLDAFNKNGYGVLKFHRKIKVCNSNNKDDLDILPGEKNAIVYSFGKSANNNDGSIDFVKADYSANINLLRQSNGPFICEPEPEPIVFTSTPTSVYENNADLIDGLYRFFWNFTSTDLIGELHCKTKGWVGFGLSPNGGMDGSDVVIGWVNDNGVANFTDRHIVGRKVLIDKISQDWKLLYSAEKNGYTIFKFSRQIILCSSEDRKIETGSPYVIFAFGESDPLPGQDISYHSSNRGSKVLNLISGPPDKGLVIPNMEILEFSISNVVLPKLDTYYYCNILKIPTNLTEKRHILKWEIVLPKINLKNIHHMVIYECDDSYNGSPLFNAGDCNRNNVKHQYCKTITHTWSVGGDTISFFPKDTGYPIGGDTGYKFIVPEIHYDNPERKIGYIEKVKIKFYMTKQLQKNELGTLVIGAEISPFSLMLPPQAEQLHINTFCNANCISKTLSATNITVVAALPHTHLQGKELWTKIIRNGNDIGYLFQNKHYDFNYQQNFMLNPPIVLTKNDQLITYCRYQTMDKSVLTLAGHSTSEEMCYQFLTYYPRRARFNYCTSAPSHRSVANFMIKFNNTGEVKLKPFDTNSYIATLNTLRNEFYHQIKLSNKVIEELNNLYSSAKVSINCNFKSDFNTEHDPIKPLNNFIETDVCNKN